MLPTAGLSAQVTEVVVVPVTTALSCWDCAGARVADAGDKETFTTGLMVTVALADLPIDGALTVTVTIVWALTDGEV
jgi:hypothetical protein